MSYDFYFGVSKKIKKKLSKQMVLIRILLEECDFDSGDDYNHFLNESKNSTVSFAALGQREQ